MKMEFLSSLLGGKFKAPRLGDPEGGQKIGGQCRGRDVEECKKAFGEHNLARVCAKCLD